MLVFNTVYVYIRVSQKKLFLKLHYLRPKNENIGGKKPFCEKISSLG